MTEYIKPIIFVLSGVLIFVSIKYYMLSSKINQILLNDAFKETLLDNLVQKCVEKNKNLKIDSDLIKKCCDVENRSFLNSLYTGHFHAKNVVFDQCCEFFEFFKTLPKNRDKI
ncbi:hypothetical protein EDEG_01879 [Edhazardia aedis USNM 41457]|uniref:Uncharacterized protein n=1 Tax=Edhazardia aedis (strain USNM 41457) TaxID=1003232 RepID=J9D7P7_EDHAE|nr:hypothetical protein EDEG_01879 [Edhazardia aedis USNM 41457]|eukprot:EJW03821.1 hypothetical protein EDEG_01879 [Edhazardia aedis USNM 41457]